ncbi:uncharacterized protein LOC123689730 [Pieris rapae]|uniref:uncharacterized protein LOC123689730 n=1 Tax=Pieris rapae TaxID=64459 RepID=UPI001E280C61|nr:uncharacterized protein LOC123689730 [Pieris rapae]
MVRRIVLLLIIAYGSCMKMRETVERTVMVRTSGSDLQPAATGFIYKRGTDGEAVVTKLGQSEVMEQLSKLYKPQEFTGSSKNIGSFEKQNAPIKQDKIIPVKENPDVDGIADDDYKKIIDEYTTNFDDYLKDLETFKEYNNKEFGFDVHHDYDPKGYNDYDTKKYENYFLAREDPYDYDKGHKNEGYKNEYKVPQNVAFRYKNNEKDNKNENGFYRDEYEHHRGTPSGNEYTQTSNRTDEKDSDENDSTTSNEESTTNSYADYGAKSGLATGKGFGYKADQ